MNKLTLREPGSAITHFIGFLLSILAGIPLLIKAIQQSKAAYIISFSVFFVSIILLYAASTLYHSLDISVKTNQRLKKFDHIMISVLIAGTYTPICAVSIKGKIGIALLSTVWAFAALGILMKIFWVNCPKWISSVLYIAMGWTCVLAFSKLYSSLSSAAFWWLLIGGIIYTLGGILYAFKFSAFNKKCKYFGSHEIFHLFVMGGSACHYVVMYLLFP